MKKILFLAAIAAMMTVGCTKEQTPAATNSGGQQTPGGDEGGSGDEGEGGGGSQRVLTGLRSAYTYYVADEALNLSVIGKPKKVVAVYSDNSSEAINADAVTFAANAQIAAQNGNQSFSVTYNGQTTQMVIPVVKGSEGFGATTLTTSDWAWASENTVGSLGVGQSATLKMFVYSSCANNYASPCVQLCNADWSANFVSLRMDNYGWDSSYEACTKESNWNWGEGETAPGFRPYQNHNLVTLTLTRTSATAATVRYDVTYWNGEQHFQSYSNIAVSDMVNFRFFTENSYAVVYEITKPEGGGDDPIVPTDVTGYVSAYTYYVYDTALDLNTVGAPKKINYIVDGSVSTVNASDFTFASGSVIKAETGNQVVNAVYKGSSVQVTIPVVKCADAMGATSLATSEWAWGSASTVGNVEVGQTATLKLFVYSSCINNYASPCVQLCNADWSSVFVSLRMDHFGWDPSYEACTKESNWNWDDFAAFQNHNLVTISISRQSATTATVRYDVTYWNGEKHFQSYSNIAVSDMVNYRFFTENSYAVVIE